MRIANLCGWAMAAFFAIGGGIASAAEDVAGKPIPDGTGFQRGVTEVARDIQWLDDFLLIIITVITLFVVALMGICIVRYNRKANPQAADFTHNVPLEIAWTAIPVLILIVIAIPSLRLLFLQLEVPESDLTIKAIGNQWYWSYEYPDQDIQFDSVMLQRDELEAAGYQPDEFLLATDTRVVVPVNATVHVLVTATDVIHAWTIPSFGSKVDAVPGRINETWFRAEEVGRYFGQCSELCGKDHTYMPIVVDVVSQADYDAWVQTQTAQNGGTPAKLALKH